MVPGVELYYGDEHLIIIIISVINLLHSRKILAIDTCVCVWGGGGGERLGGWARRNMKRIKHIIRN